ncbi:MAG: GNAT family N-acetyltransferase [Chitinophagaceae bacterium]
MSDIINSQIRRCLPVDVGQLSALAKQTFFDTFMGTCSEVDMDGFLEEYYNEEVLLETLNALQDFTFLLENEGEFVGYIRFIESALPFPYTAPGKALELNRLYIDKAFFGKGLGQMLLDFYFEFATKNGYEFLWLGVWEFNFRAQKFYTKNGFAYSGFSHPFPIGKTPQTDQWWTRENSPELLPGATDI